MEARSFRKTSGTEPKIKFYFSVNTKLADKVSYDATSASLDQKIKNIITDLNP